VDYFDRIGYRGPREASFEVMAAIVGHHVRAIPFENLDVLLGRPPALSLAALRGKLVDSRRGGYCYEHATLCAAELEALGFVVARHSARVVMVTPREQAPRTHMFLTAMNHDPGFGGLAPMVPVPLDGTPAGAHRVMREGNEIALWCGEQRLWVSSLEADLPIDFEMANHFTATWPQSPFVQRLMARAFTADGRVTLMNRDLTIARGGEPTTRRIEDRAELGGVLRELFGIECDVSQLRIPTVPEWS
jgi:N-hydroxyarylamine O-acetyltransferase